VSGGDRPVLGVDGDDLVSGPQVDIPLLAELLGRHGDETLYVLDLPLDVVGEPAGAVRDPLALLEDDDVQVGVVALSLAGGRHTGGVAADDNEGAHGRKAAARPDKRGSAVRRG
jgi:hypothetical protein